MNYFVYIIYSQSRNIFYTGITSDFHKRILYHNTVKSGFTSAGRPWKLLWITSKTSRNLAETLEAKIKNLSRERKIKFMKKYHRGIIDRNLFDSIVQKTKS